MKLHNDEYHIILNYLQSKQDVINFSFVSKAAGSFVKDVKINPTFETKCSSFSDYISKENIEWFCRKFHPETVDCSEKEIAEDVLSNCKYIMNYPLRISPMFRHFDKLLNIRFSGIVINGIDNYDDYIIEHGNEMTNVQSITGTFNALVRLLKKCKKIDNNNSIQYYCYIQNNSKLKNSDKLKNTIDKLLNKNVKFIFESRFDSFPFYSNVSALTSFVKKYSKGNNIFFNSLDEHFITGNKEIKEFLNNKQIKILFK